MATDNDRVRIARLNKRTIDALPKEAVRYTVWDSDLKGFGLRVETTGTKTFLVRYRVGGGRRGTPRQFKIGRYGKLTPDEARDEAVNILAQVELGDDPQAQRVAARETLTVSELCDLYLEEGVATKKASTLQLDRIRIKRHIKPQIGARKITDIGAGDIERLMNDIAQGKVKAAATAHTRGGKGAASRTIGLLSGIFNFATARKLCAENPTKGVARFKDVRRERFLSPKELGVLGDALTAAAADGAHRYHVAIIRLLALTGARKNEIARLKWSEVDLGRGLLQLEDSKTGRKTIRLGAAAQLVLEEIDATPSPYVFPDSRNPTLPIRNLDWAWVGIRKRAGMEDLRIHDLRHSFASVAVAGGSGLHLIGKLLGHSHVATTSRYAHLADDPVKEAADRVSKSISAAMGGVSGEVKPMRAGGS